MKNNVLCDIQRKWLKTVADVYVKNNSDVEYSRPYFFGIPELFEHQPCIMIVGQEPDDFGSYGGDWELEAQQQWGVQYLSIQLQNNGMLNPSPFWNAFRIMHDKGKGVLWNNLDKMHRIGTGKKTTQPLSVEDEKNLDCPYGNDKKSLLQREVEIACPSAIWLAVGPYREEAIEISFNLEKGTLYQLRPRKEKWLSEIGSYLNLDMPVYWTYHPKYLSYLKVLPQCVQMIAESKK